MPKGKKGSGKRKAHGGKHIANHNYAGKSFECYGKPVNTRGGKKSHRIFCRKNVA